MYDKIEQLFPVGLIYVAIETIALIVSYTEKFSSIQQFLLVQSIAIAPIILMGIELYYNMDPVISRFNMNDADKQVIIMVTVLVVMVSLNICSLRINLLMYLFKYQIERVAGLLIIMYCMTNIEIDRCNFNNNIHDYFLNE